MEEVAFVPEALARDEAGEGDKERDGGEFALDKSLRKTIPALGAKRKIC